MKSPWIFRQLPASDAKWGLHAFCLLLLLLLFRLSLSLTQQWLLTASDVPGCQRKVTGAPGTCCRLTEANWQRKAPSGGLISTPISIHCKQRRSAGRVGPAGDTALAGDGGGIGHAHTSLPGHEVVVVDCPGGKIPRLGLQTKWLQFMWNQSPASYTPSNETRRRFWTTAGSQACKDPWAVVALTGASLLIRTSLVWPPA